MRMRASLAMSSNILHIRSVSGHTFNSTVVGANARVSLGSAEAAQYMDKDVVFEVTLTEALGDDIMGVCGPPLTLTSTSSTSPMVSSDVYSTRSTARSAVIFPFREVFNEVFQEVARPPAALHGKRGCEGGDGGGAAPRAATTTLRATTTPPSPPSATTEYVFLLDRSGSMSGDRMRQAANALTLFIQSLPTADTYINVVGFGSSHEALFGAVGHSEPFTAESREIVLRYTAAVQADLGGTELFRPLTLVLRAPLAAGRKRMVFVLTDGDVSNTQQTVAEVGSGRVQPNGGVCRVFSIGVGGSCRRALVQGIADAGGGTAEYVKRTDLMSGMRARASCRMTTL